MLIDHLYFIAFSFALAGLIAYFRWLSATSESNDNSIAVGAMQFFGGTNNSYVSYDASASSLYAGTNSFTVEMWIKQDPTPGPNGANGAPRPFTLSGRELVGNAGIEILGLSIEGDAERRTLYVWVNGENKLDYNAFPVDNAWHHLAVVGINGSRVAVYVDGSKVATANTSYNVAKSNDHISRNINIGSYPEDPVTRITSFVGYLANVLYDSSTALYTGETFTLSTTAPEASGSTQLLLLSTTSQTKFDDSSANDLTPTEHGDPAPTWSSQTITFPV